MLEANERKSYSWANPKFRTFLPAEGPRSAGAGDHLFLGRRWRANLAVLSNIEQIEVFQFARCKL